MKDYILQLTHPLDKQMIQQLNAADCNVVFHDEILPSTVIVETSSLGFKELSFVETYVEACSEGLLLNNAHKDGGKFNVRFEPPIDFEELRSFGRGFGVKVAVIDCGVSIELFPDVESVDFTGMGKDLGSAHGTIVSSIVRHIARAATIYSLKVCHEDDGMMRERDVWNALKWARNEKVHIINMSIGFARLCTGICPLGQYVNAIVENDGILIVSAAGNDREEVENSELVHCPACAEESISVGLLERSGSDVAPLSSKGHTNSNKPNIVAPGIGNLVATPFRKGKASAPYSTPFGGTSFAAPFVTGVLACLVSYVGLTDRMKLRLKIYETAESLPNVSVKKQGLGMIMLPKLLEVLKNETRTDSASSEG